MSKTTPRAARRGIGYNVYYDQSNSPIRLCPSDWNVDVTAEFRQPLFQGAGVQFNRIAGPGAIPGYNNGVIIARINTDIALADFEDGVREPGQRRGAGLLGPLPRLPRVGRGDRRARQRLADVAEDLRAVRASAPAAARRRKKPRPASSTSSSVAQVEQRLSDVYAAESQLRYMMGLAATDGRLIRPADEPTAAKVDLRLDRDA